MPDTPVITRFAPSPTGSLHIGGARTALFNWLYARGRGGKFLLRIEDTDKARSTDEDTKAILDGLTWLGLEWDGEPTSQAAQADRHVDVAHQMLADGNAYKCYATLDEIEEFREDARANKTSTLYRSPWRDVTNTDHPKLPFVVRVKAPRSGTTTLHDEVQGDVTWQNAQLDDMILLRSDGSPVYMLAVVVDDHDMGVTHVIRGDDHLANAFRQNLIYNAMGWAKPTLAHIPLIFGPDGKKLSKRHGATGASEYQTLGYPAAGMRNYLTRLGWSHGDDEFFSDAQARDWFDLGGIGKSPAQFDIKKLESLCGRHIAVMENAALLHELESYLQATDTNALTSAQHDGMLNAMLSLKERAKTFPELFYKAHFILTSRPITIDEKPAKSLDDVHKGILAELTPQLQTANWSRDELEGIVAALAEAHDTKLGKLASPLRAALAGRAVSPSIFDMMIVLGREETISRIQDAIR
jgi:glutamyl-tRNA synthetase